MGYNALILALDIDYFREPISQLWLEIVFILGFSPSSAPIVKTKAAGLVMMYSGHVWSSSNLLDKGSKS